MRNGYQIIDTDSHQMEPTNIWRDYIDSEFADRAPAVDTYPSGRRGLMVEGEPITKQDGSYPMDAEEFHQATVRAMQRFSRARESGFSPSARIHDMDEQQVDMQVIYPTFGGQILGKPFRDPELLAAVCRAYNRWSLEYCSAAPDRMMMAAMLPMQAPDLAVAEAKWAAEAGAKCFYVRPNPASGRNFYHEDYDPLWSLLEDLQLPMCLHDSGSPYLPSYGDRLETHTSGHIAAHPFEAMVAMMSLIWYGVIEKHPRLKVVHVEADAGWLPYWLQRMEQHYEFSGNAEHPLLKKSPTEYFLSNFLVACRGDERTLPSVCDLVGDSNLAFNTDYPHADGTWPGGIQAMTEQPLPEKSIKKIFWDNPASYFNCAA